jgi:S-DNA-T family DNA segregation ATPase FtsK/SpoIIIE
MVTSFVGRRVGPVAVPVRRQPFHVRLPLLVLWWLVKLAAKLVWFIVRSPVAMLMIALVAIGILAERQFGAPAVVAFYAWLSFMITLAWLKVPSVTRFVRARYRRFWVYRHKWPATMDFAGLNHTRHNGVQYAPVLGKVRCTDTVDRVQVRMLAGQVIEDWGKVSGRLCQTFGGIDCRVAAVPGKPHDVALTFLIKDPLDRIVQPCYATNDMTAMPVALKEDGDWFKLNIIDTHILLDGETRSGKSESIWSILDRLRPNVSEGTAQVWAFDAKGGMELAFGADMFHRFAYGTTDLGDPFEGEFADVLEDAVAMMRERQAVLRGRVRVHTPTKGDPHIVVIIDELAALTGYVGDRDIKRRIAAALSLLLSQGAAVGITVIGATQDPRKETLPLRDLFPTRVLFRVTEAEHVALIFGRGAYDRGARADEIPESLPGVAYVQIDGVREEVRVRFAHIDDDYIGAKFRYPAMPQRNGDEKEPPELEQAA